MPDQLPLAAIDAAVSWWGDQWPNADTRNVFTSVLRAELEGLRAPWPRYLGVYKDPLDQHIAAALRAADPSVRLPPRTRMTITPERVELSHAADGPVVLWVQP